MVSHLDQIEKIIRAGTADNTLRAHEGDWRYFSAWCKASDLDDELPVNEDVMLRFIVEHLTKLPEKIDRKLVAQGIKAKLGRHSVATVERRLRSVNQIHSHAGFTYLSDETKQKIRDLISSTKRSNSKKGIKPDRKRALVRRDITNILKTFDRGLLDIRDRAIIMFGWASGGRRRSEISAARMEDLMPRTGGFIYLMPRSKTDQQGAGTHKPIKGLAARYLKSWITAGGITKGFIFRRFDSKGTITEKPINPVTVNLIVKRRVEMIGLDPAYYGAHSLRNGFMTEAGLQRMPLGEAMELTGHKTAQVALNYYQAGDIWENPTSKLLEKS